MHIDPQTAAWLMSVSSALMVLVFWVAFKGFFRDGMRRWNASQACQCLATVALALAFQEGGLGPMAAVAFYPSLLMAISLQSAALKDFMGKPVPRWQLWLPVPLMLILSIPLLDHPVARVLILGNILTLAYGAVALMIWRLRPAENKRLNHVMCACYALACLVLAFMTLAYAADHAEPAMHLIGGHGIAYLTGHLIVVCAPIAFLLMHKERADDAVLRLATTDPLTGAFNRRTFMELAEREIARAERSGASVALLMLDLDHFKKINDTHGHLIGDGVLQSVTERAQGCLRRPDLLVRYGGEEFCVLMHDCAEPGAQILAERIRKAIAASPIEVEGKAIPLTVSIGVAAVAPQRGVPCTVDALIARADEALYRAKSGGRNRIEVNFASSGRAEAAPQMQPAEGIAP